MGLVQARLQERLQERLQLRVQLNLLLCKTREHKIVLRRQAFFR